MANKVDLAENSRQVSTQQIAEYAERHGLIFRGECSALSNLNIKESFELLINKVHQV